MRNKHAKKNRTYWYKEWLKKSKFSKYNWIMRWWDGLYEIEFDRKLKRFADILFGYSWANYSDTSSSQSQCIRPDHLAIFLDRNPDSIRHLVQDELCRIATYLKSIGDRTTLQGMRDHDKGRELMISAKEMGVVNDASQLNDFIKN
ncbi:MAG: hypothetical protein QG568_369 [Patescibacteria group bacterium]|nr:hypothetical protein [Patescibacteria group bacterium]